MIEWRFLVSVTTCFLFISCGGNTPKTASSATNNPQIRFVIYDLDPDSGRTSSGQDSVWSQNDDRDSVLVLVSGADETLLAVVSIDVVAGERFEGDALRNATAVEQPPVPVTVLRNLSTDSLPGMDGARIVWRFRPSDLQSQISKRGKDLWLTSMIVRVQPTSGRGAQRSLEFLWD
jgi:hypothetical protein